MHLLGVFRIGMGQFFKGSRKRLDRYHHKKARRFYPLMWNGFDGHLETLDGKTTLYLAWSQVPIINEQRCLRHLNSRQAANA